MLLYFYMLPDFERRMVKNQQTVLQLTVPLNSLSQSERNLFSLHWFLTTFVRFFSDMLPLIPKNDSRVVGFLTFE